MTTEASSSSQTIPQHAVVGVVAPSVKEANIRTVWPGVLEASAAGASLGALCIKTRILAPLGWMIMAPLFLKRLLPFISKRYTLTNRRLTVRRGFTGKVKKEIALSDIDEIRLEEGSYNAFFHAATLEIYSNGKVAMRLEGVSEPQSFRQSILNAMMAWVPGKAKALPMIPASEK